MTPNLPAALDRDLREALEERLRLRWTHTSTALEGNTLDEGETLGVLRYGLTIAGKPLAHHNEVVGHDRAIDLLYAIASARRDLTEDDLFALHRAVQTSVEHDMFKPVGAWKTEPNSTVAKIAGRTVINDTCAFSIDVPALMRTWLSDINHRRQHPSGDLVSDFVTIHAGFVRIHPFADGNGRIARLLANLPLLEQGKPPILIPAAERMAAIESLAVWQTACGRAAAEHPLIEQPDKLAAFRDICQRSSSQAQGILDELIEVQRRRDADRNAQT